MLRALPAHRAAISAVGWRFPAVEAGVPIGPGPLLRQYMAGIDRTVEVLLVHADPAHELTGWAASYVASQRQRGTRVLAVQRGAFYGPPPPPPLDPDLILARGGWRPDNEESDPPSRPRSPWDHLALWGPAFKTGLPNGSRCAITGSPYLEAFLSAAPETAGTRPTKHAARMEVSRLLGVHPGKAPALVAFKLHGHWWPEERVHALLTAVLQAIRERNLHPVIVPDALDGPDALRIYRAALVAAEIETHTVLTPRQWRRLDLATWLIGAGAVITQGGTEGVLAAALGTPALAVVPPDSNFHPHPVAIGGHYRVVGEPLSYVRAGVESSLAAVGKEAPDPEPFRQHAARGTGAAEEIARIALDLVVRRRKGKPSRTGAGRSPQAERNEGDRQDAEDTAATTLVSDAL